MSWQPADDAECKMGAAAAPIETTITPKSRDIGGFEVRRALPAIARRTVGPFVFWDHMGPASFPAGKGLDVRPHPHIGLATVTYLFEGEIVHRDSLGTVQAIRPGEVNWMTAGRGIVHSERTGSDLRSKGSRVAGIQSWVALPEKDEETAPSFVHHGADALPLFAGEGKRIRLIAGSLYGRTSPVRTFSEMLYADVALERGATFSVPTEHEERAIYVAQGAIEILSRSYEEGNMLVLRPGAEVTLSSPSPARVMLLGGAALGAPRHVWWNFVSSSRERIEQAKSDWKSGRFAMVPGDPEFIPLPE
jgi:redox-sensitive bicupin YhaK (pirin superfamily)